VDSSNAEKGLCERRGNCKPQAEYRNEQPSNQEHDRRLLFEAFSDQDIITMAAAGTFDFDTLPMISIMLRPEAIREVSTQFLSTVGTYVGLCVLNSPQFSPDSQLTKVTSSNFT